MASAVSGARPFFRTKTADIFRLLQTGPGAVALPASVTKIVASPVKKGPGAAGLRHFTREVMPSLRFKNPTVVFSKTVSPGPTSHLTVHFGQGVEPKTVNVTDVHSKDILTALLGATGQA